MSFRNLEGITPNSYYHYVRDQLQRHVYDRSEKAFAAGDAARDAIGTVRELEARKSAMHLRFVESIGGLPPSNTPLNPRLVGTVKCDGFRIEKIIYESRPGAYVTANLYVPDGITTPRGAVLFLSGHSMEAKHYSTYQAVCLHLVQTGLVVMAQDPVGQGERFSYYEPDTKTSTVSWGTTEHDYVGSQCLPLGDALARYFVHDAMRGIDYLATRPEVDPYKIGVTGSSGGGTQTCLMMICDPRIAAAAPATFLMNRQTYMYAGGAQDAEQIWPRMTAFGFDHEDILLMMCPKPVRVLAVKYDFFPIEGTRLSVNRAKRLWSICGKPDGLDLVEDESEHQFTPRLARAAAEFFSERLLKKRETPNSDSVKPLEPRKLWCTSSGQVRGELEGARFIFEENRDRLSQVATERSAIADARRKERARAWLKDRVYSHRQSCELNARLYHKTHEGDLDVQAWVWWAQRGLFSHALVFRGHKPADRALPVTIAVWDGGTSSLQSHADWISDTCASGRAVMVLDTSGVGALLPNPLNANPVHAFYGVIHKLNDDLLWLDDSIAALRTFDVTRALDAIPELPGLDRRDIEVYACGRQGVYGQLAAFVDKRIAGIEVVNGMGSYASWVGSRQYDTADIRSVIVPGMLRYSDLCDLE